MLDRRRARRPKTSEAGFVSWKSCGLTSVEYGVGLPSSRFSQKGLLASSIDISASLRHSRPTDRRPLDRPTVAPKEESGGRRMEGRVHGYFGEERRGGGEGRPFSQQRECKSNFNVDDLSRRSRSHRFRGSDREGEGQRVREGSLSRGRIGSKLLTRRRQATTLHNGCEFRTFFVPEVNATSKPKVTSCHL